MSMGVIGSAVYVNQQIVDVASLQNGYNSRIEFQHIMAQVIANEKEQEIGFNISKNIFDTILKLHPKMHLMTHNRFDLCDALIGDN